jgi:hypothetical protein
MVPQQEACLRGKKEDDLEKEDFERKSEERTPVPKPRRVV